MAADLFEKFNLGNIELSNRMVMAPMTRNRANENGEVTEMMVTYYQQRASAGLIIAESSPVSAQGIGYPMTPNIFSEPQAKSWKKLTDAVHAEGGRIFIQLQHCGRISHPSMQAGGALPVAPSAIKPSGQAVTYQGMQDFVEPRALETSEISQIVAQFKQGAILAKQAGFDGVEVHGANGYIIDQFLRDGSNQRDDAYGGNVQNRLRLLSEILDAVCTVWPAKSVGLRLTPENSYNDMRDSDPQTHFEYFIEQVSSFGLCYLHVLEGDMMTKTSSVDYGALRGKFSGPYIANNGYDLEKAQKSLQDQNADLIAFGLPFLANPDLVRRYKDKLPLNEVDHSTFYGGNERGFTDYPFYHSEEV
ncbi:alkene reductase [Flexibacterium corallicola]|uniref:alkene reductase n=1 Tax=Flexibacterium corallicola TaxID=3037259 RepID=UPI00286FA57F|nr:alkene reductase [Pseudovibrio sp. M1P-2-3]